MAPKKLVDRPGIEPGTFRLRGGCSQPIELAVPFLKLTKILVVFALKVFFYYNVLSSLPFQINT